MRLIIQRTSLASVVVEDKVVGKIEDGAVVFLGIKKQDEKKLIQPLVKKLLNLRMFPDTQGQMNLSLLDNHYSCLVISQFTLYADLTKGRRPSFLDAETPEKANELYRLFIEELQKSIPVETGIFGAKMQVSLVNEGPVTFILES